MVNCISHNMELDFLLNINCVTVVISVVLLSLLLVSRSFQWPKNIPSGPSGYPVVGILPMLRRTKNYILFRSFRAQYGDVYSVRIGQNLAIVINGLDALKEAFVKQGDDFSDRPLAFGSKIVAGKGIGQSSGEHWKQTRSFALTTLREFGFGKKSLEFRVMEEVNRFLDTVESYNGELFDAKHIIQVGISNIICSIVFGKRFEYNDERFVRLVELLELNFRLNRLNNIGNNFPWLRFLPGDLLNLKLIGRNRKELYDYMAEQIKEHRNTYDEDNPRDFIDAFLKQSMKQETENAVFADANLAVTILNLFVAGTETTATTIRWAILQLMYHKDIQDRLRQEINTVVGTSRYPSINDKPEMPYYEAFVSETLRFGNIAPLSLPHGARKDIHFRGMTIPKGSTIIPNLDSVHYDPSLFEDPSKFRPDRFLGKDGKLNGKEKYIVAFSLGRRVCLGESLARLEMFLFLTSLLQRFELLPDDPDNMPSGIPAHGLPTGPPDYKIRAVKIS